MKNQTMQIGLHSLIFCYTFLVETEEFLSQLVSGNGNFFFLPCPAGSWPGPGGCGAVL